MAVSEQTRRDREANAEIMRRLLLEPKSGPLMQVFVQMAIEEYAERLLKAGVQGLDNPLVDPQALLDCAREAMDAMEHEWKFFV